jgi:uncharacterized protein YndB with AHSA1/START domain
LVSWSIALLRLARSRPRVFDEPRGRLWKLWRDDDFSQRFSGTFSDDGQRIDGRWEIAHDGESWETDFDLTYVKIA